jgi:hypothetical protein
MEVDAVRDAVRDLKFDISTIYMVFLQITLKSAFHVQRVCKFRAFMLLLCAVCGVAHHSQ